MGSNMTNKKLGSCSPTTSGRARSNVVLYLCDRGHNEIYEVKRYQRMLICMTSEDRSEQRATIIYKVEMDFVIHRVYM